MSVPVWCELVCSACARSSTGEWAHGAKVPRAELAGAAKRAGWVLRGTESYCSSRCAELAPDAPDAEETKR